jgi:hypothetical protein
MTLSVYTLCMSIRMAGRLLSENDLIACPVIWFSGVPASRCIAVNVAILPKPTHMPALIASTRAYAQTGVTSMRTLRTMRPMVSLGDNGDRARRIAAILPRDDERDFTANDPDRRLVAAWRPV